MYFDTSHLLKSIAAAFPRSEGGDGIDSTRFALMGTIQFNSAVHQVASTLKVSFCCLNSTLRSWNIQIV
jgi:hypothetical protein